MRSENNILLPWFIWQRFLVYRAFQSDFNGCGSLYFIHKLLKQIISDNGFHDRKSLSLQFDKGISINNIRQISLFLTLPFFFVRDYSTLMISIVFCYRATFLNCIFNIFFYDIVNISLHLDFFLVFFQTVFEIMKRFQNSSNVSSCTEALNYFFHIKALPTIFCGLYRNLLNVNVWKQCKHTTL